MKSTPRSISLQILFFSTVVFCIISVASLIILHGFRSQKNNILESTHIVAKHVVNEISLSVKSPIVPAQIALQLLSHDPITRATALNNRLDSLPIFVELLEKNPLGRTLYIGYDSGEMYSVGRAKGKGVSYSGPIPKDASFLLETKTKKRDGTYSHEIRFYDDTLVFLEMHGIEEEYDIDPRKTEWFQKAIIANDAIITKPYVFYPSEEIGVTIATRAEVAPSVLGLNVTIDDFCALLASLRVTPNTEIAIVDEEQNVVAYQDIKRLSLGTSNAGTVPDLAGLNVPVLSQIHSQQLFQDRMTLFTDKDVSWYGVTSSITTTAGGRFTTLIAIPASELLANAWNELYTEMAIACVLVFALLFIGYFLSKRVTQPLSDLTAQVAAIGNFDFTTPIGVNTRMTEARGLSKALESMVVTIRKFLQISLVLNREQDIEHMLHTVLRNLLEMVHLPQGAIYLYDDKEEVLKLSVHENGEYSTAIPLPVQTTSDSEIFRHLQSHTSADDILVPLRNRNNALLGVLCILYPASAEGARHDSFVHFVDNISKSAAIAIETRQLILAHESLLQSIIKLIADAIDTKSRYTGGHCRRVPELAIMLLDEAVKSEGPEFADFFMTKVQGEEFRVAAWLHDCGKITTPEYVVDKATKLETIYNRIHEVRTRFEVLHRDATIACLTAIANGGDAERAQQDCAEEHMRLQEEFSFIAMCNIGGESMEQADMDRLNQIAQRTWQRHFDDRIGLSQGELSQKSDIFYISGRSYTERLLMDKPSHIIPWEDRVPPVRRNDEHNIWGFDMELPKHMYNYGEIYNLSIRKGTLTEEERFMIDNHIVQTICMLSALSWPSALRKVPILAGTHHERMDGKGYPCKKTEADMTIPEMVLAVADVFEALTAGDRPYKSAKALSQTLEIMSRMVKDQHLNAAVFNLFLNSGVYLAYANAHMRPELIDVSTIDCFLVKEGGETSRV